MFDLILLGYLSYRNGIKAKQKDQNAIAWGLATAAAYIICMLIGFFFVVYNFCKDDINMNQLSSLDVKAREAAAQRLMQVFANNQLHLITIEMFGVGGYLIVRYILDRKPDKKEPEVHWMDKIGDQ
jgi:uncharacterized membrane protein